MQQVIVKRNDKMRGQAFVVFREVHEAAAARSNLNGYPIFGKPMVDKALMVENTLLRQALRHLQVRRQVITSHNSYAPSVEALRQLYPVLDLLLLLLPLPVVHDLPE